MAVYQVQGQVVATSFLNLFFVGQRERLFNIQTLMWKGCEIIFKIWVGQEYKKKITHIEFYHIIHNSENLNKLQKKINFL